ncbi:MAG: DMT family transporter [Stappiaceae bacterium]
MHVPPQMLMILAIALLTGMDSMAKHLMATYPVWQVIFARYIVALVVLAPFALRLLPVRIDRYGLFMNFLRGGVMVATIYCFFKALALLPQVVATSVFFTTPLFLTIIAWAVLKEPLTRRIGFAVLTGFLGVLIILFGKLDHGVSVSDQTHLFAGLAYGLAAAFGYAVAMVMVRTRSGQEPPMIMTMLQTIAAAVICSLPAASNWVPIPTSMLPHFLTIGLLGAAGMICLVTAFSSAHAAKLGIFEYTAFLWASFYGYVFFSELPHWTTGVGAVAIIFACYYASEKSPKATSENAVSETS